MKARRDYPMAAAFGEALRHHRQISGLSQDAVAERLGVERSQISLWEHGRADPGIRRLAALARAVGCPLGELVAALEDAGGAHE